MKKVTKRITAIILFFCLILGLPVIRTDAGDLFCRIRSYKDKNGRDPGKLVIDTPEGSKIYQCYAQIDYGYEAQGCVVTAVAIAASAYGKAYTPKRIQEGKRSRRYSVRYAVKKMKASAELHGKAAISVSTAAQILKDMGIQTKAVYRFKKSKAIKEIKKHVKKGKPVLIKANAQKHNGIQIANAHHAILLVGLDEEGYGIFIDPMQGKINYAHGSGNYFRMKINTLVNYHMTQASGNYKTPYVTNVEAAGGYILIG